MFSHFPKREVQTVLISKWQAHILSLLDNPKSYEVLRITLLDKQDNILPLSEKFSQDMMRFILLTLYFEVPYNFDLYIRYKEYRLKERAIRKHEAEFVRQLRYMNSYFSKNGRDIFGLKNQKRRHPDKKIGFEVYTEFETASENLIEYLGNFNGRQWVMVDKQFSAENNYLLKREITSKAGIRNLAVRYACLCLQVSFGRALEGGGEYQFLYEICSYILNTEDFYLDITREVFDKTVRNINIKNPEQGYADAFEMLDDLDSFMILAKMCRKDTKPHAQDKITASEARDTGDEEIIRHILQWRKIGCTCHLLSRFSKIQYQQYSKNLKKFLQENQNEFLDEFLKTQKEK